MDVSRLLNPSSLSTALAAPGEPNGNASPDYGPPPSLTTSAAAELTPGGPRSRTTPARGPSFSPITPIAGTERWVEDRRPATEEEKDRLLLRGWLGGVPDASTSTRNTSLSFARLRQNRVAGYVKENERLSSRLVAAEEENAKLKETWWMSLPEFGSTWDAGVRVGEQSRLREQVDRHYRVLHRERLLKHVKGVADSVSFELQYDNWLMGQSVKRMTKRLKEQQKEIMEAKNEARRAKKALRLARERWAAAEAEAEAVDEQLKGELEEAVEGAKVELRRGRYNLRSRAASGRP